uniref:Uncharacterized protein n=1 Tax=Panagrolaimus davidi TaxID=227884 RepID=A0A914QJ70_9BILA
MSNVKVFRGSQTDELLYEYNKSTNANVNTLMLASGCYTIVVPAAKSIAIDLNVALTNTFTLSSYPYKALWATPNYGSLTVSNTLYSEFLSFNVSQNVTVQIKIKTFDVSSDGRIEFVNSKSNSVFATHAGQQLKFTNDSVKINYYEKNAGHYGVSMEVETLKKQ